MLVTYLFPGGKTFEGLRLPGVNEDVWNSNLSVPATTPSLLCQTANKFVKEPESAPVRAKEQEYIPVVVVRPPVALRSFVAAIGVYPNAEYDDDFSFILEPSGLVLS